MAMVFHVSVIMMLTWLGPTQGRHWRVAGASAGGARVSQKNATYAGRKISSFKEILYFSIVYHNDIHVT